MRPQYRRGGHVEALPEWFDLLIELLTVLLVSYVVYLVTRESGSRISSEPASSGSGPRFRRESIALVDSEPTAQEHSRSTR